LKAANILITNTGVIKIGKQFASNLWGYWNSV
jgi:hypothetical protein